MADPVLVIKSPSLCSVEELELFRTFLSGRPDVRMENLNERIAKAGKLAFAFSGGELAGIAALKRARKGFRRRILESQTTPVLLELPKAELGWLYVDPASRGMGIGAGLVSSLCRDSSGVPMFALTTEDNETMRKILLSNSFSFSTGIVMPGRVPYLLYSSPALS
ncbi:MAG: GNAT family N-acetyltransferase [Spirochaetales bacterium]|nr:GNAT family N-acetyltransferase [Spirochaetales bacterium]